MTGKGQDQTYRFDSFVFESARGILRASGGADLPLRPKALALLVHLLDNPGRLLRREDLLDQLWPGVTVTDDSLTQCMSELRQALGERAPHVLRTVPRQGYVMIATVQFDQAPPAPALRSAELTGLRRAAVAFLPFDFPAADPACQHLATSLAGDLRGELSTFEEVRLVPAAHPTAYRVHGEVRPSGSVLRVLVSLQAADGMTLWTDRLDAPRADGAELDDVAVGRLAVSLARQVNREDLLRARETAPENLSARQLRLLGADHHQLATEADNVVACELLERAIALDPGFALPYIWLSYAVQRGYRYGWKPLEPDAARSRALALAQRAVQLEPGSALCQSRLGSALVINERWQEAAATARRAVAGRRNAPWEVWTTAADVLVYAGEPEEALVLLRRALAQDLQCPPLTRSVLGRALLLAGHPDEALPELQWCGARLPHYYPIFDALVVAATETGQPEIAQEAMAELDRLRPPDSPEVRWLLCRPGDVERYRRAFAAAGQNGLRLVPAEGRQRT